MDRRQTLRLLESAGAACSIAGLLPDQAYAQGPASYVVRAYATSYRSLRGWRERDAVSTLKAPRFVFAGANDQFVAQERSIRIGPLVAEILRQFFDPLLLPAGIARPAGGEPGR